MEISLSPWLFFIIKSHDRLEPSAARDSNVYIKQYYSVLYKHNSAFSRKFDFVNALRSTLHFSSFFACFFL